MTGRSTDRDRATYDDPMFGASEVRERDLQPAEEAICAPLSFHWHNPTLHWRMPVAQLVGEGLQDVRCPCHDVPAFIAGTDSSVRTLPNPWVDYACRKP